MDFNRQSDEVFYASGSVVTLSARQLGPLCSQAAKNPRRIARLCTHRDVGDRLHEMVIVNRLETYIRPHRNTNKPKSFLVLKGSMDVVMFSDSGQVTGVHRMGDFASGLPYYFRLHQTQFHTLRTRSDEVVFQETTVGPFQPGDTVYAPWAPDASNPASTVAFLDRLDEAMRSLPP